MSHTYYKVKYTDHFGPYGAPRDRHILVHEHNTSDVTTVYNEEGEELYGWHADNREQAERLCQVIQNAVKEKDREFWDGELPVAPRARLTRCERSVIDAAVAYYKALTSQQAAVDGSDVQASLDTGNSFLDAVRALLDERGEEVAARARD